MKSVLTIIGTRPEAIKLAPVLLAIHASKSFKSMRHWPTCRSIASYTFKAWNCCEPSI
jgi:hypothetical protein